MSEEVAAFARLNEFTEPVGLADDMVPDGLERDEAQGRSETDPTVEPEAPEPDQPSFAGDDRITVDPFTAAVLAPDGTAFIRGVVAAFMQHATQTTDDPTAFGIVLSLLGGALAEGQDEAETLRELAEVVSRQRLRPAALADLTPVVAAFLARVVIEPHLDDTPFPPEADELMRSAHALVTTALETGGGARAWRQLPGIALAIAQYATRRGLSIPALAEALPRLAARFGGGPREATPAERQQPRGGFSRAAASDALRRMHISGPVEIVILDR